MTTTVTFDIVEKDGGTYIATFEGQTFESQSYYELVGNMAYQLRKAIISRAELKNIQPSSRIPFLR